MATAPILLDKPLIDDLLASKETFIFDCDGVLWRQNDVYPRTAELIKYLRKLGKKIFFVSNNNTKARRQYLEKFYRLGIDAKEEEIYSSGYAAAYYIKHVAKLQGKVYVIGSPGLVEELEKENISHIGSGPDEVKFDEIGKDEGVTLDPEVTCVLHGFDSHYNYNKIRKAVNYLAKDSVQFIATNKDMTFPSAGNFIFPGTGCLVTATEVSAGRKATIVGKPGTLIMDCIVHQHNIDPRKACVFGDNICTDIEFGNRCSTSTVLVLTGVSSLADVESERKSSCGKPNMKIPEFYIDGVTEFYNLTQK
ncbi:glycerol-3-phosphate phosphatase-like [Dendronephthya gigantea]|uniref:glycerol-3-phosphate phosphatase-like n=1 Tax=Dendronephthya gigantea TaxID=151771 RepID=UPI00106B0DC4|nr:glycerol-3-phosphate phosphatase-like [Dendronephthya gigantea]